VQLFITTNSNHIFSYVNAADIFVLQKDGKKSTGSRIFSSSDNLLASAVKFPILGLRSTEGLILIEGDQDNQFIRPLTEICDINTTGVQFLRCAKYKDSSNIQPLITSIQNLYPDIQIHILRDSDFFLGTNIDRSESDQREFGKEYRIKVFYWDLPAIESYLFLDWCERTKNPFSFLHSDEVICELMAKFMQCWRDTNNKVQQDFKFPEKKSLCSLA